MKKESKSKDSNGNSFFGWLSGKNKTEDQEEEKKMSEQERAQDELAKSQLSSFTREERESVTMVSKEETRRLNEERAKRARIE